MESEFLTRELMGVPVSGWLLGLAAWAIIATGLILIRRLLRWRVGRWSERSAHAVDGYLLDVITKTRLYFLIGIGLYLAVAVAGLPEGIVEVVGRVVFIVVLLQVVRWGSSLISLWIDRYKERKLETDAAAVTTMQAVGFLAHLALWTVVLLLALQNFGIEVTALIAGLGVGGVAVALAVQNILGDLFASLAIVLDKPFVVGDFLAVNEFSGTVEHVGLKTTRLRGLGGEQIVFSNNDLLASRIRNYKRMYERRVVFSLGVVYQTPHAQLEAIPAMLRAIVQAQDRVRFDRAHLQGFGDFAILYEVVYYVLDPDYHLYMDIQQAINLAIHERFEAEGIELAYPTQSLYLEGLPQEAFSEQQGRNA